MTTGHASATGPTVTLVQLPNGQTVQVHGVIQAAQPSVIQSPQVQAVQVGTHKNTHSLSKKKQHCACCTGLCVCKVFGRKSPVYTCARLITLSVCSRSPPLPKVRIPRSLLTVWRTLRSAEKSCPGAPHTGYLCVSVCVCLGFALQILQVCCFFYCVEDEMLPDCGRSGTRWWCIRRHY